MMKRSFVAAVLAILCIAKPLPAADSFVVTPSDQDLFGKVGEEYKVRVRLRGKEQDPTEVVVKIEVWKISSDLPDLKVERTVAGDVKITNKGGETIDTLKVKKGEEDFRVTPLMPVEGKNLVIRIFTEDPNKPIGYMVLPVNPIRVKADEDIRTVSTPIGVGRH